MTRSRVVGPALAGLLALLGSESRIAAQDLPVARPVEEFRLGGPMAPEPFTYQRRPGVVVSASGLILVRRANAGLIDVLGADGRHIRSIGGLGEGPGEFRVAMRHGLVGDTLWVRDFPNPRISTFLLDGTFLETEGRPVDFGARFTAPTGVSGLLVGGAFARPDAYVMETRDRVQVPILIGNRDLTAVDTLVTQPNPDGMFLPDVGNWGFTPYPLPPLVSFAGDGSGILIADWTDDPEGPLELRLVDSSGASRWARTLRLERRAVSDRVRDSLVSRGMELAAGPHERARARDGSISRNLRELVEAGLPIPEFEPPVFRILLGVDGSVWLQRSDGSDGRQWLVLDPSGESEFEVTLPASVRVAQASREAIWATDIDDLDVPYLVKYRLEH